MLILLYPELAVEWKLDCNIPEKAFSGNGKMYKGQARIAELEIMLGQLNAENVFAQYHDHT